MLSISNALAYRLQFLFANDALFEFNAFAMHAHTQTTTHMHALACNLYFTNYALPNIQLVFINVHIIARVYLYRCLFIPIIIPWMMIVSSQILFNRIAFQIGSSCNLINHRIYKDINAALPPTSQLGVWFMRKECAQMTINKIWSNIFENHCASEW